MSKSVAQLLPGVMATLLLSAGLQDARALSPNWEESGQASWYGPGFHGKRTSSGARFDQNALTAAHDTLPLGTKIRVTTQETGRSVVVTITDRLPPKWLRIIDVSRAAAARLGIVSSGVGMVTLTEARDDQPIEVAEAPDDGLTADATGDATPPRHDRRHTRRGARTASAAHGCCHAPSAVQAQR